MSAKVDFGGERQRVARSGVQESAGGQVLRHITNEPSLVGRDSELAQFSDWTADVASGIGHAALVEGEPGVGKSSLVRTVVRAAEQRGLVAYWAECDELGQALPLQPLLDAMLANAKTEPRLKTIQRLLRDDHASSADLITAASEQMLALMTEWCSASPTVLVVDDLQWADAATLRVWEWLARSVKHSALLVVGMIRPVPQRDDLDAVRRAVGAAGIIHLDGLSDAVAAELVAKIAAGVPSEDLLRLASGASGNPLYLTELMGALVRAGRLTVSASGAVDVTRGPVPDSLVDAITDRLGFLRRDTRTVLQAAALLGVEFLVSDLAIVLDRRVAHLVPVINEAVTADVLREAGEKLAFRHPLIRAALYDDIPAAVRPAWHQDAARELAEAGAPVQRVARQLQQAISMPGAGPLGDALVDWLTEAAPMLVSQAPRTAIELLEQASQQAPVGTPRGAILVSRLAEALYRAGECAEAEMVALRAVSIVADPDVLVDLHWTIAQCRALLSRADEALETLTQANALPGLSSKQRARLLVLTARAHRNLGEVSIAGNVAAKALATAEEAGDPWALAWSLHVLIIVSMMRGDVAAALPLFERALRVVGNDPALTDVGLLLRINKAVALGDLDRYEEALDEATRVRQLADTTGSLVRLAQAHTALGELLFEVGRWDDAQAEVETLPDDFKDPGALCCDRGTAAVIAFHRGDAATARHHLSLAAYSAEQIGNRVVASLTLARSLDHEISGEPAEALAVLTGGVGSDVEELDEMEDLLPEAARLAAQIGAWNTASEVAEQAAVLAKRSQVPHRTATELFCRGMLAGDPYLLQTAAERYLDAGRPLQRAKALEAASVRFASQGDHVNARSAFMTADELYHELGANWDLAQLRAQLRRYKIHRGSRAKHRQMQTGWASLTATETKIAGMVAEGLSNRQVAERLVLSTRTVDTHVSHILNKLQLRSRVEIAREAAARS